MTTSSTHTVLGSLITQSPTYTGEWMPVFIEPIPLSGERITACIAAVGADGKNALHATLDHRKLKHLYGSASANIQGIINLILESLQHHLNAQQPLSAWQPPLDGAYPGRIRQARSASLEGIINQGIRTVASLAEPIDLEAESTPDLVQEKFSTAVRDALLEINSQYRDCINRRIMLNDTRERYYGFTGKNYIANYAAIANAPISLQAACMKIMDLEDLALDEFSSIETLEMIIAPPINFLSNPDTRAEVKKSQRQLMEQAKEAAKKRQIHYAILETPQAVAAHLHQKAA